ncbi:hypothetical protein [Nitrosomonas sp. Nm34]|uniref:hypothetical protein n=1 Tax=Nitrosomonas sp. Nm34 TaxID=1881055 RepID=UPI0008ED3717|nr:hypothetical protein [Nitrosomonas sp. Nm34]SFI76315.1 hypothetical protein SAMN05428978_103324 [Nitrosomonas sp. Nm34]
MDLTNYLKKYSAKISKIKDRIQILSFFATLLLPSIEVEAFGIVTKGGHFACLKKEWLIDMLRFKESKRASDFQSYLKSKKCIILRKGIKVVISEFPSIMDNTVGLIYRRTRAWTTVEALDFSEPDHE